MTEKDIPINSTPIKGLKEPLLDSIGFYNTTSKEPIVQQNAPELAIPFSEKGATVFDRALNKATDFIDKSLNYIINHAIKMGNNL